MGTEYALLRQNFLVYKVEDLREFQCQRVGFGRNRDVVIIILQIRTIGAYRERDFFFGLRVMTEDFWQIQ